MTLPSERAPMLDWESIARSIDAIDSRAAEGRGGPRIEKGGDAIAKAALSEILGQTEIRVAVRLCVAGAPGAEVARSVLHLLRSPYAADECLCILRADREPENRRSAAHLMRAVADASALNWFDLLIGDPDPDVRSAAVGLIDEFIADALVSTTRADALVETVARHPDPNVRARVDFLRETLARSDSNFR